MSQKHFNNEEFYVWDYKSNFKPIRAWNCTCGMCENEFNVFDEDIKKNENSFRCEDCGQIYVLKER